MNVILFLGAHRTGMATFDDYMRRHAVRLASQGVSFWGPRRARQGILSRRGSADPAAVARAHARVRALLDRTAARGVKTLVVSDPQMVGSIEGNVTSRSLYPRAAENLSLVARPFRDHISSVMFSPRSLDTYWCSALARGVAGGVGIPGRAELRDIVDDSRSWRDVITDVASALPGVPIRVLPFENFMGRPDALLAKGAGFDAPFDGQRKWLNRSPGLPELRRAVSNRGGAPAALPFGMGRWNPFTNEEHAILREKHADDMMWLASGADGRATLTEDCLRDRAGPTPPAGAQAKGQRDELEERHMARPG
ncbi:MAG: hypothetical protein AAF999_11920 [Pseudomonadota bacterium]